MIKYIITLVVIYFIVRSISNKPWIDQRKAGVNQSSAPKHHNQRPNTQDLDGDFVDYEEVE